MQLPRPRFRIVTLLLVIAVAGAVFALLRERRHAQEEIARISARAQLAMQALLEGEAAHLAVVAESAQQIQAVPEEAEKGQPRGSRGLDFQVRYAHVVSDKLGVKFGLGQARLLEEPPPSIMSLTDEERAMIASQPEARLPVVPIGSPQATPRPPFASGLDSEFDHVRRFSAAHLRVWMEVEGDWGPEGPPTRLPTMEELQERGYWPVWGEPRKLPGDALWPTKPRDWPTSAQLVATRSRLLELASDEQEDWKTRCCAVWTLGHCQGRTRELVRRGLEAIPESPRVRAFILEAIARMGRMSYGPMMQYETHYGWAALQDQAAALAASGDEIERERTASALRFIWFPGGMQSQAQTDAHYSLLARNTPVGRGYAAEAIRWNFHLVPHVDQLEAVKRLLYAYRDETDDVARKKIAAEFAAMSYRHGPRALGMASYGLEAIPTLFSD